MKVKVKNYQAIKNADLTFEPGVTVIVGSSNNGKSSIIRAIEAAINNKGGSDFINYDADACDVLIEDNGHVIKWHKERKSTKSYYQLNEEKLNKIGQKQIEEVGTLLNMPEIIVNNDKFRLNFWKQLDFPFLVGKTHYQLFDFISKSKDQELMANLLDETSEQNKNSKSELSDINAQINTRTQDINAVQAEIEALTAYEQFDIDAFEHMFKLTTQIEQSIEAYEQLEENVFNAKRQLNKANEEISKKEKVLSAVTEYIESIKKQNKEIYAIESKLSDAMRVEIKMEQLQEGLNKMSNRQNELLEQLNAFDVCPFCHQPLDKNHGGLHE